ncbi:MAG: hypothetical protein IJA72_01335, partial [Clostridia bacterium]|nr:hypothetical protein [Clostridia bacterium]
NYYLQFVTEDIEGNTCSWGGAEIVNNTNGAFYIWNQQVQYNTFSNKGYVLKNQYYINVEGGKVDVASGEMFDPAKFQIETISGAQTFKIHLVLDLKTINLAFENSTLGSIDGFDGEWVTNSVTRQRNGFSEPLTSDFKFRTGDTLVMNISTAYAGIKLNEVRLGGAMSADGVEGGISIKNDEESNYKLTRDAIKAEDKVRNYTLTINFIPDLIDGLNENTIIFNCLELQVYNIRYTYNLINYKFGVVLAISIPEAGGSSGGADEELTIENISYSSARIFTLDNDTLATFNDNFKVTGFSVPGGKHTTNETSFKLNWTNVDGEVNYWEQIALACYKTNTSDFVVTLVLEPNITLSGYDVATSDVTKDVYNYITTYNGNNQGLSKFGDAGVLAPNVSLGGGAGAIGTTFIINISYNVDGRWTDVLPINAGSYPVQITASIPGVGSDEEPIKCDKTVNLVINKALLVIKTKFDAKNPLSKTYNKQNTASKTEFLANVSLMLSGAGDKGVYERDNVKIDIDTLNLIYASSDANADMNGVLYRNKSLYDVKASNVRLTGVGALNYKLTDALAPYATSFTIGMIKAKPLTIKGLTAFNKTYDGTNSVKVDASSPIYDGRLEGDVAEVLASNLKFYLEDVKVGVGRKVLVDATDAIIGTSSTNYSVTFETMTIDIHPNELIYTIAGYGTVKVVDRDGLCKIPIGSEIKAFAYEKGSEEYNSAYSRVQDEIEKDEKFKNTYTIYLLNSDGISQSIPAGLYLYLPKINKLEQAIQLVDDDTINTVETLPIDGYSVIKMEPGSGTFAILVSRTYVPLWVIILIVSLSILAVAVFAGIIIIMKHKSKNKYSAYNKI